MDEPIGGDASEAESTSSPFHSLNLTAPLNALSASPDGRFVIVGGRDVLRVVDTANGRLIDSKNLRVGRVNLNYSTNDVKWHPMQEYRNLVASAASNGAVVLWNLDRTPASKLERVMTDHTRSVNRVCWHRADPMTLISASHDGTMKLWDTRDNKGVLTLVKGRPESVRDVEFHPHRPHQVAAAYDNGCVQIWDVRHTDQWVQQITAHHGLVLAVNWHPVLPSVLATGSRDRMAKIWNLEDISRPTHVVQGIASMSRVLWRPDHPTQIGTCASLVDYKIHVWDITRPFVPLASVCGHRDVCTGFLWYNDSSETALLSTSKDSTLQLSSLNQAYRPYEHLRTTALTWSIDDDLAFVSDHIDRSNGPDTSSGVNSVGNLTRLPSVEECALNSGGGDSFAMIQFHPDAADEIGAEENPERFRYFAENYKTREGTIPELCDHNSKVAEKVTAHRMSAVWMLLKMLFEPFTSQGSEIMDSDDEEEEDTLRPSFLSSESISILTNPVVARPGVEPADAVPSADQSGAIPEEVLPVVDGDPTNSDEGVLMPLALQPPLQPIDTDKDDVSGDMLTSSSDSSSSGLNTDGDDDDGILEACAEGPSPLAGDLPSSSSSSISSSSKDGSESSAADQTEDPDAINPYIMTFGASISLDMPGIIAELLEYYSQCSDVQTCVTLSLVLAQQSQKLPVDKGQIRRWTVAYLDMLQRMQLWTASNQVIRYHVDPVIRATNQASTSVYTMCPHCDKPMFQAGHICETCSQIASSCAICQEPVRGLYAWCQVCGHGGHATHIRDWFTANESDGPVPCPAGCSHFCNIEF